MANFKILCQHPPEGTKANREISTLGRSASRQDFSQELHEYKSAALSSEPFCSSTFLVFCFLFACIYFSVICLSFHFLFFSHSIVCFNFYFFLVLCAVFLSLFVDALFLSSFHLLFCLFVCLFRSLFQPFFSFTSSFFQSFLLVYLSTLFNVFSLSVLSLYV